MRQQLLRLTVLGLVLSLVVLLTPHRIQAAGYSVVVQGKSVPTAVAEMKNGNLMVSVRPFAEAMGATVAWVDAEQRATVSLNGSNLALWIGNTMGYQDGSKVWAPVAPYLKNGKTMVSAWWLAVRLDATVKFDGSTLTVTLPKQNGQSNGGHPLMKTAYVFPYPVGARYETYYDGMGDPRFYNGQSFGHEGTDILAGKGTPIVAVAAGTVVRFGWNELGGYRVTVQLDDFPEYRFYYAHMDRYAANIWLGAHVRIGQVLGYVGNTGEGPERTEGKFVPHLHFGIYGPNGAINPFPMLKFWEQHKIHL